MKLILYHLTIGVLIFWMLTGCRFIVNHFAFYPDRGSLIPADGLPAGVEELFITTPDRKRLQCYWLARPQSRWVLIYFHGNAGNIGHRLTELTTLAAMDLNVLGVSYRGYGKSDGRPSEAGIYTDGKSALSYVTGELGFKNDHVILLGRSIGSTVAVEIGRSIALGGCILVTPFTDGIGMARRVGIGPLAYFIGNPFDNLSKIRHLRSCLLIVHGTNDEIVPFEMGRKLFEQAPYPKQFVSLAGAGHNEISLADSSDYRTAVALFIAALKSK